jgi:hypothetical protein
VTVEEYAISRQLPWKVADAAVDVLVHQANWVAHEMLFGTELTVMVWYPEGHGHGAAEIHADIDKPGTVVAVAPRWSEFWQAVKAVENNPILRGGDG